MIFLCLKKKKVVMFALNITSAIIKTFSVFFYNELIL